MELKFSKPNLVYLLLVVHHERRNGIFFENLREELEKAVRQHKGETISNAPSRATWYNYFRDFEEIWPNGFALEEAPALAFQFISDHPKATDKFYRKFNRVTFERLRSFLEENGYIGDKPLGEIIASVPGSLYFSLVEFLKPKIDPTGDHISLPGTYRAYRPSLGMPGKILVSAARITSKADGSLHYEERMHFRTSFGWRQQHLEGYVLGIEGKAFFLTKDDNTKLMQFSIMKPYVRQTSADGKSQVRMMAGSYTGTSQTRQSGLFTTGIVLVRDNLRSMERFPVQRWKIGHLGPFGYQSRDNIPEEFLPHLFE